jgi:surface polysaccharide O-acyltransferase-like enzyme
VSEVDPESKRRYLEVDALKSAGIVVVVLIHSMRSGFVPNLTSLERWIGIQTRFAVPAFLMVSGFLYATRESRGLPKMVRRLRRILLPYLVASLLAQAWSRWTGRITPTDSLVMDFLLGSSFGPYYYVFVIVGLVFVTTVFARMGRWILPAGLVLAAIQWLLETRFLDLGAGQYWQIRNPLLWWAYFLAGWGVRRNYDAIAAWIRPRQVIVAVGLIVLVGTLSVLGFADAPEWALRSAAWVNIYAISALIFTATTGLGSSPTLIRVLSDATYPTYLLHLFFVYEMARRFPGPALQTHPLGVALSVFAGLFGSLAVIFLARKLLGRHSRDLIGA